MTYIYIYIYIYIFIRNGGDVVKILISIWLNVRCC